MNISNKEFKHDELQSKTQKARLQFKKIISFTVQTPTAIQLQKDFEKSVETDLIGQSNCSMQMSEHPSN
jgi:hypothetical protein